MAILNSYVSLPEGTMIYIVYDDWLLLETGGFIVWPKWKVADLQRHVLGDLRQTNI